MATGTVTVAGDGFPTTLIDFGRSSQLTIDLSGSTLWSVANVTAGTATPAENIEGWQRLILKESGAQATDIIMTTTAYAGFLADPLVHGAVFYPALGQSGNVLNPGAQIQKGAIFKGNWGSYRIWLYNDWFVDDNNYELPMLIDGTVIMTGPDLMGVRAFAQIIDPKFNYESLPFAPKMWLNEDPAQLLMLMQSAPLVIPARVNASLGATVAAPVYD